LNGVRAACGLFLGTGVLAADRRTGDVFEELPFHYLEIAHLLFTHAKDSFGADLQQARLRARGNGDKDCGEAAWCCPGCRAPVGAGARRKAVQACVAAALDPTAWPPLLRACRPGARSARQRAPVRPVPARG
jgi:hypothetical protein